MKAKVTAFFGDTRKLEGEQLGSATLSKALTHSGF
jgi:hypothetical protein